MAEITNVLNNRNASITNYDVSEYLFGGNSFGSGTYTDGGAGSTLPVLLLLGKVAATGALVPLAPAAIDGSQFPIGLLWLGGSTEIVLTAGQAFTAEYVNKGKVDRAKIGLPAGVTLADVIVGDGRTVEDYLNAMGLILETYTELTVLDNQP